MNVEDGGISILLACVCSRWCFEECEEYGNEYCGIGSSLDRDFSSDGFRMFRNVPQEGMMKEDSLNTRERSRFFRPFDQTLI